MDVLIVIFIPVLLLLVCIIEVRRSQENRRLIETVTSVDRGERSERLTIQRLLKMGIDSRAIFHDCYVRKANGSYTQVDLVVATSQGLLVFEIKDYSGWIFGDYRQKYWTQVLAYGREKHRFYNPIMQNNGHIQALRDILPHNPDIPIYSIIVFYGSSELRDVTLKSDNDFVIYPSEIRNTVRSILSRPVAEYGDKREIMTVMRQAVLNGNNPKIVSSQIRTASFAGQGRPQSTYSYFSFNSLFRFRQFRRFF